MGEELSVADLARLIAETVDFKGRLVFDPGYPDGTLCKRLDIGKITQMDWQAAASLPEGLAQTYIRFRENF